MPLKINGNTVPYSAIGGFIVAISWLIGLSYQVGANDSAIEKHVPADVAQTAEIRERLVKIETNQEANKDAHDDIKDEQREQDKKLDRILEAVGELKGSD